MSTGVNMQSLCGLSSPVDSVAFDSAEVLVLAGASSGVIKLWDLEESKSKLTNQFIFLFNQNLKFLFLRSSKIRPFSSFV